MALAHQPQAAACFDFFATAFVPLAPFRFSFSAFAAENLATLLAAILMVSPVCGLHPGRAARLSTLKGRLFWKLSRKVAQSNLLALPCPEVVPVGNPHCRSRGP